MCVARHEGRVVFVRHALPGEHVRARVTEGTGGSRYWRADAIEVLEPSPDRVVAPCPYAVPGGCGGCDWQHAAPAAQRRLKATVVAEQLTRLAGLDWPVEVERVPGASDEGLGWRTRVSFAVGSDGRPGLHKHRSHEVVRIEDCLIAHPGVRELDLPGQPWPGASSVEAIAASTGDRAIMVESADPELAPRLPRFAPSVSVVVDGERLRGRSYVREEATGRVWRVSGGGFWQVHPGAAETLVGAVLEVLDPRPGDAAVDLYSGVGLFAGALAERVGPEGSVLAVEADERAVGDARRNLHDLPWVRLVSGRVDQTELGDRVDLVVLDPPRSGAGRAAVRRIAASRPRAIAYVACDPATLARDVATFAASGYVLSGLRAFDLFPMTHHVECVAALHPRSADR